MRTLSSAVVLTALFNFPSAAEVRVPDPQRIMSGRDIVLVQAVLTKPVVREKKLDLLQHNVVITDGDGELYVTFEPVAWRQFEGWGSPPGKALELVLHKETLAVKQWYWSYKEGR